MINPLAIATRGRISKSIKKTLTYATLGWLVATSSVTPIPDKPWGGNSKTHTRRAPDVEKNITYSKIIREDDEILTIIKIFLQCQR
jgi:hypothetical protein